ncbi:Impact family [Moelleriella libera RCEF 2490]|uniref:Impact family n=1 Tax=Moelleriella libera RCEF 2490 TaxID=1081109 RepID=A0A168E4J8_9HYPO|nr:Impact family [Moelleriella libera RCEF 2490]
MSDELLDEVEAINSIYGDGSLTRTDEQGEEEEDSPSTYILRLPGEESSSLRLQFPRSYPHSPPCVAGTHHSSRGVKGAGAKDVRVFTEVLGAVYRPGEVCLFDAVEEFSQRAESAAPPSPSHQLSARNGQQQQHGGHSRLADAHDSAAPVDDDGDGDDGGCAADAAAVVPEWVLSEAIVESKSTFLARVARVTSPEEAARFIGHLVASDRKVRGATHNITAWRVRKAAAAAADGGGKGGGGEVQFQDCDDDGETAAGARLLHLLQVMDVWGIVVVVSRWFGGVKLGPRRFALINAAARDALVKADLVRRT